MRIVLLLLGFMAMTVLCRAQYVYTINADSVKITNHCDSAAELIILNHTQGVTGGFLYNTWGGRTIFKKVLQKINDSIYLIGPDTLKIASGSLAPASGSSNYINQGTLPVNQSYNLGTGVGIMSAYLQENTQNTAEDSIAYLNSINHRRYGLIDEDSAGNTTIKDSLRSGDLLLQPSGSIWWTINGATNKEIYFNQSIGQLILNSGTTSEGSFSIRGNINIVVNDSSLLQTTKTGSNYKLLGLDQNDLFNIFSGSSRIGTGNSAIGIDSAKRIFIPILSTDVSASAVIPVVDTSISSAGSSNTMAGQLRKSGYTLFNLPYAPSASTTSGTYIPTVTANGNSTSVTTDTAVWMRIGNIVTVNGMVAFNATAASTTTGILVSLPVPSVISGHNLWGMANATSGYPGLAGTIMGQAGNPGEASFVCHSPPTGSNTFDFQFSYSIN